MGAKLALTDGPLKEIDGYQYIFTAVDYKSKFVKAEPLEEKKPTRDDSWIPLQNCCACMDHVTIILQTKVGSWWTVLVKNFSVLWAHTTV